MGYILIDTCVWINLASSPELDTLVDELVRVAPGKPDAIVVPQSVSVEFKRTPKTLPAAGRTRSRVTSPT